MASVPVITIDGPSGSGKGTISRMLAHQLGWHFLDSGSLYRLVALGALQHDISLDNESQLADYARQLDVRFESTDPAQDPDIWLENQKVDGEIRTEQCGDAASRVAAMPGVRQALLQRQRDFLQSPGLVADGRDMGTIVFPNADLKIFLTASAEIRAERRHKQLKQKGIDANLAALVKDIAARDARDSQRAVSPLKPADDATVIDCTEMEVSEVLSQIRALAEPLASHE